MICHNVHYAIAIYIVQWFQGVTGGTFKRFRIKYQTIIKYRKGGAGGGHTPFKRRAEKLPS